MSNRRLALILLAISTTGILCLAAGGVAYFFGRDLLALTTSAPSPAVSTVDEEGTCLLLIPAGQEVVDHIKAFAANPDGSTTDWAEVEETVVDLKSIRAMSAPDFHADIDAQITPLEELLAVHRGEGDRTVSFEDLRAAGLHIAARCIQYAD